MKTTQGLRKSDKGKIKAAPALPLKVFIGYADLAAFRGATSSVREAIRCSSRSVELHPMLWRFEQLSGAHWWTRAIHAALEADIVVLASSTPSAITPTVENWINAFLRSSYGRRTTLVVITGSNDAWTISLEESAIHAVPIAIDAKPRQALVA